MNVFVKNAVLPHENDMHTRIHDLFIDSNINVPKPIAYSANKKALTMELIKGMSLSDWYGEKFEDVERENPDAVAEVRRIVRTLHQAGIVYPDITGYNFMIEEASGNMWIIDFEHAAVVGAVDDTFVRQFMRAEGGVNSWNSDFE